MALALGPYGDEEAATVLEQVHNQSTRMPIKEAAESLQRLLTSRLTAYMAGVKDVKTVSRWVSGEVTGMRLDSESRLRAAYEIMILLLRFDGPDTVRAWFIGMNPQLNDESPAEYIHQGRLQDAMNAARSFVAFGGANYA